VRPSSDNQFPQGTLTGRVGDRMILFRIHAERVSAGVRSTAAAEPTTAAAPVEKEPVGGRRPARARPFN
jgi:hypothetical protein